jgi:hypothetical protein
MIFQNVSETVQESLATAQRMVETGSIGTVAFVELTSNPLTGVWWTAQKKNETDLELNDIEIALIAEPDNYPEKPEDLMDLKNDAFLKYEMRYDKNKIVDRLSRFEWKMKMTEILRIIAGCTEEYGRMKCYENGDMEDNTDWNMYTLHVCDVFNIAVEEENERFPELYLESAFLGEFYEHSRNELFHKLLTKNQINFLIEEIDFVYSWFSYWNNQSIVPIRTKVFDDSTRFKELKFFTNDHIFCQHQEGKMKQLYQDRNNLTVSITPYRSI